MREKKINSKMLKCRLCNKALKPNDAQWIFSRETNEITALGQRLMAILNIEAVELRSISHVCCEGCSFKAQDCFALLMDVHAGNAVIKKMHEKSIDVEDSIHTMMNTVLFECDKCTEVMDDMRSYTQHFEIHTLLEIGDLCNEVDSHNESGELLEKFEFESFKTEPEDVVIIVDDPATKKALTPEKVTKYVELRDHSYLQTAYQSSKTFNFECDICNDTYETKVKLRRHIKSKHLKPKKEKKIPEPKVSICKICSGVFQKGQFKKHAIECRSELLSQGTLLCDMCGKNIRASSMTSHLYKHRELRKGIQTCPVCQKKFNSKKSLRTHLILHDDTKLIVCEVCGIKTHPHLMWKHSKKHKDKEAKCDICGRAFMFNYMLQTHKKTHEKVDSKIYGGILGKGHQCPKCDKEYTYVSMLNIHLREDHNDPGVDIESIFPCKECNKTFDDKFSLKNHLLLMHNATKEDLVGMRKQSIILGVFHCPECGRILQSDYGLRTHLRVVHNLKNKDMPSVMKRKCEKCDKTFSDKQGLLIHIKAAHLNIADIQCNICGQTFKRYQSLVNHKLQHTGAKPFECEVCLRTFRQRADVIRHLQRHVRDGDATLEEAAARNNSESSKLRKNRVFLKDSKWGNPSDIWGTSSRKRNIKIPDVESMIELE